MSSRQEGRDVYLKEGFAAHERGTNHKYPIPDSNIIDF
jgi:hypothetical protein